MYDISFIHSIFKADDILHPLPSCLRQLFSLFLRTRGDEMYFLVMFSVDMLSTGVLKETVFFSHLHCTPPSTLKEAVPESGDVLQLFQ